MAAMLLYQNLAQRAIRRDRVFRDRTCPLDYLSDPELLERYRFRRDDLIYIIGLMRDDLEPLTLRDHALSAETKVLIALRYASKGSFYSETGDIHGISRSSMSRYVHLVFEKLRDLAPQFVRFPTDPAWAAKTKQAFYQIAELPGVLGAVDGTHVAIRRPVTDEEIYMNRKNFHSINCQGVCDADLRFTNFVAKWPGATHDSFIWNDSALKRLFEEDNAPEGWLLGDSAYAQKSYMMVPFRNPATQPQQRYNAAQAKTRNVVERAFGVWKSRFRAVHHKSAGPMQFTPEKCCNAIMAMVVLHNIAINRKTPLVENPLGNDDDPGENPAVFDVPNEDLLGNRVRDGLVDARFT